MFEIGFWELALLFALGLVVLGPEKLPKVAAQFGRYAGQARRLARTLTAQIRDEIDMEERRAAAPPPATTPAEPQAFNRPGAASLIPGEPAAADGVVDESGDTTHRPQPD